MNNEGHGNDLQKIIAQGFDELKHIHGESFDPQKVNLAELERITGLSRSRLRTLKKKGFDMAGTSVRSMPQKPTVLDGYTGIIDDLLSQGVSNSSVCFDRLKEVGYTGGLTTIKTYISRNRYLLPPKRHSVSPQGNRGRRYVTDPGEVFQMDWGFVNVHTDTDKGYQAACFAMVCHHCGACYIEFFPNAKQENLFIGMLHGFIKLGVPKTVLTDNMKSVVIRRDAEGHPIWQKDYEAFMDTVGFFTKLCRPRHPFTKGKVERLVRYVKENFLCARTFGDLTDLNYEAERWCSLRNMRHTQVVDIPIAEIHKTKCSNALHELIRTEDIDRYLSPERIISFDGFVSFEGRRYGVPYRYTGKTCRVKREGYTLHVYSADLKELLTTHDVTWSKRAQSCDDQYEIMEQPEEFPSQKVTTDIRQTEPLEKPTGFEKFNFDREELWDE